MRYSIILPMILTIFCTGSSHAWAWVNDWPEPVAPSNVQAQWVSQNMQHNGVDMKILKLSGVHSAEKTAMFYQNLWQKTEAGFASSGHQNNLILSTVEKNLLSTYLITLELKASETKTDGFLSIMRLDSSKNHPASVLDSQLPPDATILSDTLSKDHHLLNRTTVARVMSSPSQNEHRYTQLLINQGWNLKTSGHEPGTEKLLRFYKQNDELVITLLPHNGTQITTIYTRSD